MGNSFIAIDFETANEKRSSVCEVGLSFVENGKITETRSWLVKPKNNRYKKSHIDTHGITPKDTENSPEFDVVWKEIFPLIQGNFLIAHYAAFDMYVLRDVLDLYGLEYPDIKTFCSCTLSERVFPGLSSYKLEPVCDFLSIPLINHHRAGYDAKACAEVWLRCIQEGQIKNFRQLESKYRMIPGVMSSSDRSYIGPRSIRSGISYVGYYSASQFKAKHIVDENLLNKVQILSDDEFDSILSHNLFEGKKVINTGTLSCIDRDALKSKIIDAGGKYVPSINKLTNIVILGEGAGPAKIKTIKAMQQSGHDIICITEQHLEKFLELTQ